MKLPVTLDAAAARFDRLSLRERGLIVAAVLVIAITAWNSLFMQGLGLREKSLSLELSSLESSLATTSQATATLIDADPTVRALARLRDREAALKAINARLATESAGLIPPSQMVDVIHDVLSRQQGLALVSLQNLPVRTLAPEPSKDPKAPAEAAAAPAGVAPAAAPMQSEGPYVHPVELVVEGRYLDIVAYLHALEGLPWRFYWRVLELETKTYPLNRVRVELSTVSLDKEWIGV